MLLRPRQTEMVSKIIGTLKTTDNTLAIAPTGAGKTVMLSSAIGQMVNGSMIGKTCVLQHRDELVGQNRQTFDWINEGLSSSVFQAGEKSWDGDTTFAMVQTLSRDSNLSTMPKLDALVIDEAHHACADSYVRIIEKAKHDNPDLKLLGVTATPMRGDKKGLRNIFDNVCDQITVAELIQSGHLVQPRTFVMDVGTQGALSQVRTTMSDYDMNQVADIMDKRPINDAIVSHWKEKAGDRQTVVFCSTVEHALHVADAFKVAGVATATVHGRMSETERRQTLKDYADGKCQVITNVAVLTEGWDHPPTSCVVLLRPSSFKSTMIQMIGRGLRTIDPKRWPGITKTDCVILDFGTSTVEHGSIEQSADLGKEPEKKRPSIPSEVTHKNCPSCNATVPTRVMECSLCGYIWTSEAVADQQIANFGMREVNILKASSFLWCDAYRDDSTWVACGFNAWGAIMSNDSGNKWQAIGGFARAKNTELLASGDKAICLAAANDWINRHENESSAHKSKRWLYEEATSRQLKYLPASYRNDYSLTRYEASALLTLKFNKNAIQQVVGGNA